MPNQSDQTPDPQPPYPCDMPPRFAYTPYAELPVSMKARVDQAVTDQEAQGPPPPDAP